jgi:hypothetical protein
MKEPLKYIIRREIAGFIKYFETDDLKQFAKESLYFHIDQNDEGGWEVWLLGENVAHYNNEWEKLEVERDYFSHFFSRRVKMYNNIEIYSKCSAD